MKKMGKGFRKGLIAAALSAVTVLTAVSVTDAVPTVQAASKETSYVGLRTAYKTLKVNETNKMTLKNNTAGWRITKIATEDRTVAMVYKKTASDFMIKGKSAGKTKVKARLKADRKKNNSKLVKCTVNVISESQEVPVPAPAPAPAPETAKKVATQAELDAALANRSLTEITIDTKEKQIFTIPDGDYSSVAFIVKAPQSEITNNARFKSIDIQEIAKDTWHENANGNTLRITASSARIIVGPNGVVRDISFTGADANVKLVVNGTVENVTVSAKMSIEISSDLDKKPTVPMVIDAAAQGTVVTAQTPLSLTVRAVDTVLDFKKGSEGSTVNAEVKTTVKNNSSSSISVKDANNNTRIVQTGASMIVNNSGSVNTGGSSSSGSYGGGSSSGGSSVPVVTYYTVSFDGKEVRVRAGDKVNESDVPARSKRNGDGYLFSGWYYADGKDDNGNTKYVKFDLGTSITKNIDLYARWAMTEEDRIRDVRGVLYVTSGAAVTVDLSRSRVTVAAGDDDEAKADFIKINDTAITGSAGETEVGAADGKLGIIVQLQNGTRIRTEISIPAEAEAGAEVNLAECTWESYQAELITVSSQEALDAALADRSYSEINIQTPGAISLTISGENRQDARLFVNAPNAQIENNAVFKEVFIQAENCSWTEHASGNRLHVLYWTSAITAAEDAEISAVIFNWGGDGTLAVNGTVNSIYISNDKNPDDAKQLAIAVSGTAAANIPFIVSRRDASVTTEVPLDVIIYDTAPRTVVNFEAGSGNSTVTPYVEAEINNHSGQEIIFKETGR